FKYPDLPKTVQNISIDAQLKNETGLAKDTFLTIGGLTFKIDDELFRASGSIRNLTQNALINMSINGTLDLAKIDQVFPMDTQQGLSGVFTANVTTQFDMQSLETEQYQNIRTNGTASLSDFNYRDPAFKDEIRIQEAEVKMSPGTITLKKMEATTGQTDIAATGTIQNLIPWIMVKQDLKGRFNVRSKQFDVNDFMTADTQATAAGKRKINAAKGGAQTVKIPDFLDATLDFSAQKVIYDNVTLEQTSGTIKVQDEAAVLSNVRSKALGGDVAFSGDVNTKDATPTFSMDLDLQKIDIEESFGQLALLKYIAPVAQALDGDLNTTLRLQGELNNDLTPNLKTLAGNAIAQVLTAEVSKERTPLLSKLGEQLRFLNLEELSLRNISTALDFDNGNIVVHPFDFEIDDVKFTAGGSHGLDKSIDYDVTMDMPARLLGGEVNKLLSKLDPQDAQTTRVSIPMGLNGTLTQPSVNINTQAAVNTLTQRLIEKQKQELENKGLDILEGIIGGKNNSEEKTNDPNTGNTQQNQSGAQEETTKVVRDILGGIFGKKKKKKDSIGN
ncbi:MAG: AsmA-like C-terminal region-containing protein, partial [Bacteroidota bacterium]